MLAEISVNSSLLIINLLYAAIALAVGLALGAWLFKPRAAKSSSTAPESKRDTEAECRLAAERAWMASHRIQDLAKGMASDVGAHATQVEAMTDDLRSLAEEDSPGANGAVFMAVGRIVEANSNLQQRLSLAEKHIETQATELRSYESEARTDSLTGLANRRAFDDEMSRRFAEWKRRQTPFSLLMLDIDHFKKFNDSHGHPAGDELLRRIGKVLTRTARQMDLACRYGGEEFAVILPSTDLREANLAAERFRRAIQASVTRFDGKKLSVTSSIGIAQAGEQDDPIQVVRHADEALYKSKAAGRNCCHWHDGEKCLPVLAGTTSKEKAPPPDNEAKSKTQPESCLANGPAFIELLRRRVVESHRFGLPISVMYLRVEDYETILHDYGQSVAHMTLDSVDTYVNSALREMDVLARLDDGEFIAMLPGSTDVEGSQIARRIQSAMANCVVPLRDQRVRLRVSHGIAQLKPSDTAPTLIERAKAESQSTDPASV